MTKKPENAANNDLDVLFMLPLAEFTAARNALGKRLKQEKRDGEADAVKALPKPPLSAWAVNQLYWKHRSEFDQLMTAGARLSQAQAAQLANKGGGIHGPMATRREAVSVLLRLAGNLLTESGHSSTPDAMLRIQTTLETLSTSSTTEAPHGGRLTEDLAPLGFESLLGLSLSVAKSPSPPDKPAPDAALRAAERRLRDTQSAAEESVRKLEEAISRAETAENNHRHAEALLAKAQADAEEGLRDARDLGIEVQKTAMAVTQAEDAVNRARAEFAKRSR